MSEAEAMRAAAEAVAADMEEKTGRRISPALREKMLRNVAAALAPALAPLLADAAAMRALEAAVTEWDAAITRADRCGWLNASREACDAATAKLRALAQPAAPTANPPASPPAQET